MRTLCGKTPIWIVLLAFLLGSCNLGSPEGQIRVRVLVDGKEIILTTSQPMSVRQILQQGNITVGDLDRLNPNDLAPITDGMVITIVRVENRSECIEETLPYSTETYRTPDLAPGTTRVMRPGVNGTQRICFDVLYEDGVEKSRVQSSATILTPPTNQLLYVGIDSSRIEPIAITGLLAYWSGGQARYIEGNSTTQGTFNTNGNLDGRVFALSPDGRQLLYTRKPDDPDKQADTLNELWVLLNTGDPNAQPVRLIIDNVLTASWVPGVPFTFTYSTLRPRAEAPGYQALNDLYRARLDSITGKILEAKPIIKTGPLTVYGVWGTRFEWSPDGAQLAWAQADGVGLVDLENGALQKLVGFEIYGTTLTRGWLWLPDLAWSRDGGLLLASVHGNPLSGEPPDASPVFDVAAIGNGFKINPMLRQTGMWAGPRYSPLVNTPDGVTGHIAYLQARDPIDSVSSEYDLVIADRDGSNPRTLFPGANKPGIRALDDENEIAWSPDGRQIALVYQGNIHVIDVASGRATMVTLVGDARHPRWVR